MPLSFLPKYIYPSLTAVSPEWLLSQGVRLLLLDFDNTVVPYTTNEPTPEMYRWLMDALASPLRLCVISNSRSGRVVKFCERYGIECLTCANKPFSRGIRRCLRKFGICAKETALIGDQIYSDVLGANCSGVLSILVPSIDNHNFILKLRHVFELPFIFLARGRRVKL